MKKPRILLAGKLNPASYADAVNEAGGIADFRYLPPVDTSYDGLILCGGSDIDPAYYNESLNGSVNIDAARDTAEFALLKAYVEAGKPVMGICRGYQLINVFFGGTMYQHIPEAPTHTNGTDHYCVHDVTADPDSIAGRLYGKTFSVNSAHHQAVKELGKGLRATAWWEGRYIEAFEHTTMPIFGFQWHPEKMCFALRRDDTVDGKDVFLHFLQLCRKDGE